MSKFRNLIESVLLNEASVIKIPEEELHNHYDDKIYPKYIPIYKNPNKPEFDSLYANSKEKELRGLAINDNIYIWDAYWEQHESILSLLRDRINIPSDSYIADFLYTNKGLEASFSQHNDDNYIKDPNVCINVLLNNSNAVKLFGKEAIKNINTDMLADYDE